MSDENSSNFSSQTSNPEDASTSAAPVPPSPPNPDDFRSQISELNEAVSALKKALEAERKITKSLRDGKQSSSDSSVNQESFSLLEQQLSTLREQFDNDRNRFQSESTNNKKKIEELKNYSKQKEAELVAAHKALAVSKIKYQFSTAAREAKVKSPYVDLLFSSSSDSFQLSDDGSVVAPGGVSLSEYLTSLKETMPEIFSAPKFSGTGSTSAAPPETNGHSASVISRDNFLDNLEAIIAGDAIIG